MTYRVSEKTEKSMEMTRSAEKKCVTDTLVKDNEHDREDFLRD